MAAQPMIEGPQPAAAASTAQLEEVGGPELQLLLVIIMTTPSARHRGNFGNLLQNQRFI